MVDGATARGIALLLAAVTGASAFAGGTPDPEQPHNFAPGSPHWQHERGPLFATFNPCRPGAIGGCRTRGRVPIEDCNSSALDLPQG